MAMDATDKLEISEIFKLAHSESMNTCKLTFLSKNSMLSFWKWFIGIVAVLILPCIAWGVHVSNKSTEHSVLIEKNHNEFIDYKNENISLLKEILKEVKRGR
jgi:hypothetical protein